MRRVLVIVRVAFVFAAPLVAACSNRSTDPVAAAIADGDYYIRGTITEAGHPWGYLVKAVPGGAKTEPSAVFTLASDVVIRRLDGSAASKADLQVGRTVSVWITGIVMESSPVQVSAKSIVID